MVTEVTLASSSCGGAFRLRWRRRLELEIGHGVRGNGEGAHMELVGRLSKLGDVRTAVESWR